MGLRYGLSVWACASKRTISLHEEGKYFYKWPQLWSFILVDINGSEWTSGSRRHHFLLQKWTYGCKYDSIHVVVCIKSRLDLELQIDKSTMDSTISTMEMTPPTPTQIPVLKPPPASTKCHFCSCAVVGPNVSRMICYAPLCDRVFHSFCYDIGILHKHILLHFNTAQPKHPVHTCSMQEMLLQEGR
jgi:hypothetical protein